MKYIARMVNFGGLDFMKIARDRATKKTSKKPIRGSVTRFET